MSFTDSYSQTMRNASLQYEQRQKELAARRKRLLEQEKEKNFNPLKDKSSIDNDKEIPRPEINNATPATHNSFIPAVRNFFRRYFDLKRFYMTSTR